MSNLQKPWCVKLLRIYVFSIALLSLIETCSVKAVKINKHQSKRTVQMKSEKSLRRKTKFHDKLHIKAGLTSTKRKTFEDKSFWHRSYLLNRSGKTRNDVIEDAILTLPEFHRFLEPLKRRGNLKGLIQRSDYSHLRGTVRRIRLYCRVGIGYHLVITAKGKIRARHKATSNGKYFNRFSINDFFYKHNKLTKL